MFSFAENYNNRQWKGQILTKKQERRRQEKEEEQGREQGTGQWTETKTEILRNNKVSPR